MESRPTDSATEPPVTVVIPTYNRRRALEVVWPSYFASRHVGRVIVVDDASTDGTAEVARALAADAPRPVDVLVHTARRGAQGARATGVRAARSPWVLFGEDDVWLEPGYVDRLLATAAAERADIVGGRLLTLRVPRGFDESLVVPGPARYVPPDRFFDMDTLEADFGATTDGPIPVPVLHAIALVRRELFARAPFDDWYAGNGWREETDFFLSAGAAGARILFEPGTACHHLRGPISAMGGQRIARWRVEYFVWRNTHYLMRKHWPFLQGHYRLTGSPLGWTARFFLARQRAQVRRVLRSGFRSTFDV